MGLKPGMVMIAMLPKRSNNSSVFALSLASLVFQAIFIVLFKKYRGRNNSMRQEQIHKMLLAKTYPSSAEEWCCPVCGRRFVVQWTPEYQKTILEMGDEFAIHNTGKGAMIVQSTQSDPWLTPWLDWLDRSNLKDTGRRVILPLISTSKRCG
jgi:hypothetical protein